ncbi:MAG: 2Fe-2S iron-sulfur cluster-binding protein [Dehalococcoidia bacterium]|nr:2Fe-2S iron-sulfur cluster-binding protein [Dehalococcoidia bacterium]
MSDVSITMNGVPVGVREGSTILEAARESGVHIPTLCYLEGLPPFGSCRLCVVEVEGFRTLIGSCHTPVAEGMVIHTHSPKVIEARRALVELMLASHPDNCLVCDKANLCELRKIAADLDIGLPRFRTRKHYYPVEDENPHIVRDMSKCIMCRRCVAACRDLKGQELFSVAYRGFDSKVVYGLDESVGSEEACRDCDVCISLCPTGALSKPVQVREKKKGPALFVTG